MASASRPMNISSNLSRPPSSRATSAAKAKFAARRRRRRSWSAMNASGARRPAASRAPNGFARALAPSARPAPTERPRFDKACWTILPTPEMNRLGASLSSASRASTTSRRCGWQRMRPWPMIWNDRVMTLAPSTVMAMGIDMYAAPAMLSLPIEMPDPARTSMPALIMTRPRSVTFCFMIDDSTMGASWLSTTAFMNSVEATAT
mmetsp:Transcript_9859/g.40075  ORF Transcript_9859/g.40075 Transcript_9859/m.40075 type:complete len:205 (+) Transcript_9859:224-838(+)